MSKQEMPDLQISVTLDGMKYDRNLKDDLMLDDMAQINDYLIHNPGKTAFWNALYQRVNNRVEKQKVLRKRYYAEMDKELRKKAKEGSIDLREKEIDAIILSDDGYIKIEDQLFTLQESEGLLKAAVEAMKDMRSTLISLSANLRTEMGSNISVKDKFEANTVVDSTVEILRRKYKHQHVDTRNSELVDKKES